jgi:prolyl 4-hydroxylase
MIKCLLVFFAWIILTVLSESTISEIETDGSMKVLSEESPCEDENDNCSTWAIAGECDNNPFFMHRHCSKSCRLCDCVDTNPETCPQWAIRNKCLGDMEEEMYVHCPKSCRACGYEGEALGKLRDQRRTLARVGGNVRLLETPYGYKQVIPTDEFDHIDDKEAFQQEIQTIIHETDQYMETKVAKLDLYNNVRDQCFNQHELCAVWKYQGLCDSEKRYTCAPTCQACEELDFYFWCPLDESQPMALSKPGDLDALFQNILDNQEHPQISIQVLSMPNKTSQFPTAQVGPWLLKLENFLSSAECQELIALGTSLGYTASSDQGSLQADGTYESVQSTWRTSSTAWCSTEECQSHEVIQNLEQRIQSLTRIPPEHSEHFQLLYYAPGDYYRYHHDCTPHHKERQMGPRILTLFLYLNTPPSGGGGTSFPNIPITVQPQQGTAILWPNVLSENPNEMDIRTAHEALAVVDGEKYGANVWIHQRNWREVAARGCI